MIDFLISKLHDARFMTMLLAAIAGSATAYTLIMPLFASGGRPRSKSSPWPDIADTHLT